MADHAQRTDAFEDKSLATNDQFATLLDGHVAMLKLQSEQHRGQVTSAVASRDCQDRWILRRVGDRGHA